MGSVHFANVPGAYVTSIRIRIFEIINENNIINKTTFI